MTAPAAGPAAALLALDAAYRAAISTTAIAVLQVLVPAWTSVNPADLRGTGGPWIDTAVDAIEAGQRQSTQYANLYTEAVRRIVAPDAPPWTPPPAAPPTAEQIRNSVEFVAIKELGRDLYGLQKSVEEQEDRESAERTLAGRQRQLAEEAITRAAGTAIRYVTTAGQDQIKLAVQEDEVALGWVRTTKPGCCHFCAMLASRGIVYKEESFELSNLRFKDAEDGTIGEQKVHDNCMCGLRPVYTRVDDLPDRTEALSDLWIESQRQRRPDETAINAFRRIYGSSELSRPASESADTPSA